MHLVHQRFGPRPGTLVAIVAIMFAIVLGVTQASPAAAWYGPVKAAPTKAPAKAPLKAAPTKAPLKAAPTKAPVRPAVVPARPVAPPARPAVVPMPRAGGGGMATSFVGETNGNYGLGLGLFGLVAVGGAGMLYARRLRFASDRVLLH